MSYTEILRGWTKTVIRKQYAAHSMEEVEEDYANYASDIIAVVGQDEYDKFLEDLLGAIEQYSANDFQVRGRGDF